MTSAVNFHSTPVHRDNLSTDETRHSYEQAGYTHTHTHTQRSNSWLTWTVKQLLICVLFVDQMHLNRPLSSC